VPGGHHDRLTGAQHLVAALHEVRYVVEVGRVGVRAEDVRALVAVGDDPVQRVIRDHDRMVRVLLAQEPVVRLQVVGARVVDLRLIGDIVAEQARLLPHRGDELAQVADHLLAGRRQRLQLLGHRVVPLPPELEGVVEAAILDGGDGVDAMIGEGAGDGRHVLHRALQDGGAAFGRKLAEAFGLHWASPVRREDEWMAGSMDGCKRGSWPCHSSIHPIIHSRKRRAFYQGQQR